MAEIPLTIQEVSSVPEDVTAAEKVVSIEESVPETVAEVASEISTAIEAALSLVKEISQGTANVVLEEPSLTDAQPVTVKENIPEVIPESVPEQTAQESTAPMEVVESAPASEEVPQNLPVAEEVTETIPEVKQELPKETEKSVEVAKQTEEPQPPEQKSEPEVQIVSEIPKPMQNGHREPAAEEKKIVAPPDNLTQATADQSQSLPVQSESLLKSETVVEEKQKEIVGTEVRFDNFENSNQFLIFDQTNRNFPIENICD